MVMQFAVQGALYVRHRRSMSCRVCEANPEKRRWLLNIAEKRQELGVVGEFP